MKKSYEIKLLSGEETLGIFEGVKINLVIQETQVRKELFLL